MSGSSNNSWTIVTPEETAAAETLRPLAEGTERQDEPSAPTQGLGAETSDGSHGLSEEDHPDQTSEEPVAKPNEDSDATALPSSAPSESSSVPEPQTEGAPVDSGQSSTEPESFSDSYSHLSPSADETPAPPLNAETLGYLDSGQEEPEEEAREQKEPEEELKEESQQLSPLETPQDPTEPAPETEPELRRRRLEALEKIGQRDEEEEAEEDFQLPQRDEDSGITLNKCILGAVILLGLGTIFMSGVLMDLDEESDYPPVELKESESSEKQEWLNPDISRPGGEAELLDKLTKGNEQIEMLQEQHQSQNEELKLAKAQSAEGSTERLQQEEVQQENSRLKRHMEGVPELQKALEKMTTELKSVSMLQKDVETLKSTLNHLKLYAAATAPLSGQMENHSHKPGDHQMHKKDKYDRGVKKDWKDGEKSESKKEKKQRKDGGKTEGKEKEWKKDKSEGGGFEKRYKEDKHAKQKDEVKEWKTKQKDEAKEWKTKQKDEAKEWKTKQKDEAKEWKTKQKDEAKEWKKDKSNRGDEGKPWKEKKEKKEWTYEGDKKHKHDQVKEGRSKESKYSQETHKGPGDKHWKKGRDDYKEEKDKYEKKHWKGRDEYESRNRKDDGERREKGKEKKWAKDEKKQWKNEDKEKKRVEFKEKKHQKEWEEGHFEKYNKHKSSEDKDHTWNDKKPKPKVGQPEYWSRQRERLQHSSKPQHPCDSPDTCAQAEGVQPVLLSEFESILKNYLSKAEKAGVEPSHIAELQKLATEMFQNGVFPHDQMSFQDYVEDVGDILEDLVEGEDGSEEEEDSAIEDEMEGFEMEVMEKFMLPGKKEGVKAEFGKESGRGRG
ncbi:pre-B-cell leukemia homeobox interacting protein 1b isoform X4 [Periophthalmus magnuspinnatus]|uniref:pre-B-cell leukemia homeobox interacting protein 1b isoform X4 n=1 Tax=Periophthalmus magnuspinnatus TaxID=409849 RepID=UPI002436CB41|nr:pre-B-cell leukemia homeobox interacting protein 1b isoform X4 [Periophthalmus magnuspinnatus]